MEDYQIWIAFGMLVVSVVTSIASYLKSNEANNIAKANRTNALREKIHYEQVECTKEYLGILTSIEFLLDDKIGEKVVSINQEIKETLDILNDDIWYTHFQYNIFIEPEIDVIITKNLNQISKVINKALDDEEYNSDEYEDSFFYIENALREMLGVETLAIENRKLLKRNS